MNEIRTTKIDGVEFVTYKDYLRLEEENQKLKEERDELKKTKEAYKETITALTVEGFLLDQI